MGNTNAFQDVIDAIKKKERGMKVLCNLLSKDLERQIKTKKRAPWTDRTSHARQGLSGGSEGSNGHYTIYVSHGVSYGEILENGSKPHNIHWKNRTFKHPGTKGYHTLENTLEENKNKIENTIIKYWKD